MRRNLVAAAFVLSLFVHGWVSTAAAQPVLEVTDSSNPIVEGVVQLEPGDQSVSITFGIVPEFGVTQFDGIFLTAVPEITVDDCAGVENISIAQCPPPIQDVDLLIEGPNLSPPATEPFVIGTSLISVGSGVTAGEALRTTLNSFIQDGGTVTPISAQIVATVVPEPAASLLMCVSLATLCAVARFRREESQRP